MTLNRRRFLGAGLAAGVAAASQGCNRGSTPAGGEGKKAPAASIQAFELDELSVEELQQGMRSGRWSAQRLCELYRERIGQVDAAGPRVNAVIELNPDALTIARQLDEERKAKGARSPLHGIPVLIKDNIDTHDNMTTTAGSLALEGSKPARDAFLVERLRAAGAVILGKTNLSEWANFRSNRSVSGWSGRGGQTRNPYALDRNPCGSSSGSGAAVAANLCVAAIGTETDGSIVCPSTINSVVGIKPTLGLVSRSGIIPIAHSQDTAGPMARSVADAAALLTVIVGADPRDGITAAASTHAADYTRFLQADGLRGARLGVARDLFPRDARVRKLFDESLAAMKSAGAEIVDPVDTRAFKQIGDAEFEVLLYEFKADLNAYLAGLGPDARVKSLEEVIAFNEKHRDREMPYFGQEIMLQAQGKGPLTEKAYLEALSKSKRAAGREGIDAIVSRHKLDAIITPTGGLPWLIDYVNGDQFTGGSSSEAPAVAGYPHITVPAGYVVGLPVGLSFIGLAWSEPVLIRLAYSFEKAMQARRAPWFLPTAELTAS
jgi:amidase